MKIQVKELGAIKEGVVDLNKSISLFCGQNNTGKTYLSFIIYAITRYKFLFRVLEIDLKKLIEEKYYSFDINSEDIFERKKATIKTIKSELPKIFGISEEDTELMFKTLDLVLLEDKKTNDEKLKSIALDEIFIIEGHRFKLVKKEGLLKTSLQLLDEYDYSELLAADNFYSLKLMSHIVNRLVLYPISKSVIFPVERNSIFTFSKELSINKNMLIDQLQMISNGKKVSSYELLMGGVNRYPLAIKDGLNVSNDLGTLSNIKSEYYNFGVDLEKKLLNGQLQINKKTGVISFVSNRNKKVKMPIHMTASIVKTLSSLIFYLKYSAEKNDLLIIDEPEMNLHPDNQILLTKIFAQLYNRGLKLLISTHSDYVIREFNNLIMASSISSKNNEIVKYYNLDEVVKYEDVGVYYFHFPKSNTSQITLKNIPVDNTGFEIESIDVEINSQSNRAMDLYYTLNNT